MTNLKKANYKGGLEKFIKEHKADLKGDATAFEATLPSMAGKSKEAPPASSREDCND